MKSDYYQIAEAIKYLESNVTQQPTLEQLAAKLHFSPGHCQRTFKRWAGISPKRFLQLLTVEHAKQQLATSGTLEAAYASGLSGPSRLHDHFVNIEAITPAQYRQSGSGLCIRHGIYDSPFGRVWLAMSERGVCAMEFLPEDYNEAPIQRLLQHWPGAHIERDDNSLADTVSAIFSVPSGKKQAWPLLVQGTNFQIQVWKALLRIPLGRLTSYQQIALSIQRPKAVRAVANAIGANPISFLIPCHRVLRNSGALGGYRWGVERKRAMIVWESALFENPS